MGGYVAPTRTVCSAVNQKKSVWSFTETFRTFKTKIVIESQAAVYTFTHISTHSVAAKPGAPNQQPGGNLGRIQGRFTKRARGPLDKRSPVRCRAHVVYTRR